MITNQSVLKKMAEELQSAQQNSSDHGKVKQHARAIRLLADLLLDDKEEKVDQKPTVHKSVPEELELRKMMGTEQATQSKENVEGYDNQGSLLDF